VRWKLYRQMPRGRWADESLFRFHVSEEQMLGPFYFPKWYATLIYFLFVLTVLSATHILLIVAVYELS
jgi:hypothetical protein